MNSPYEENDSGQDIPEEGWDWIEMTAMVGLGLVAFFIIYVWAK